MIELTLPNIQFFISLELNCNPINYCILYRETESLILKISPKSL